MLFVGKFHSIRYTNSIYGCTDNSVHWYPNDSDCFIWINGWYIVRLYNLLRTTVAIGAIHAVPHRSMHQNHGHWFDLYLILFALSRRKRFIEFEAQHCTHPNVNCTWKWFDSCRYGIIKCTKLRNIVNIWQNATHSWRTQFWVRKMRRHFSQHIQHRLVAF